MTAAAVFIPPLVTAAMRARLEALTPAPITLSTGVAVVVGSWLVDSYGTRTGVLEMTKSDGTRIVRRIDARHDGPPSNSSDALNAYVESHGFGTSTDFTDGAWLDVDLNGAGVAQLVRLLVTAAANGASWTAIFYPDFLKAP